MMVYSYYATQNLECFFDNLFGDRNMPIFHSMKVYHKEGRQKKIMTIIRYSYATQHLVCDKIVQDRNHEYKKVQGRKI